MKWLRRVRGAIGTGLTWAIGWAAAGISIGVASLLFPDLPWQPFFDVFDAPLPAFGVPGFFAGLFFSLVVGVAARRRRLEELSLRQIASWGAISGVLLTLFPFVLVAVGLASREGSNISTGQILVVLTPPFVLFSIVSATATLLMARSAARRGVTSAEVSEPTLDDHAFDALGDGARDINAEWQRAQDHIPRTR